MLTAEKIAAQDGVICFRAFYEDAAKAEAAAKAEGFTGNDGESWHDFIEVDDFITSKRFESLGEAVAWLKSEIADYKTAYGVGDIRQIERMPRRCQYCTCRGAQATYRWVVDDEGICDEETLESQCCDD